MIALAVAGTFGAALWSGFVVLANGMRASPGEFRGGGTIAAAWVGAALLWLAWGFS
jgi:hypothetical protein